MRGLNVVLAVLVLTVGGSQVAAQDDGAGAGPRSVTVTVLERAGVARTDEYVAFGVPLPREWKATSPDQLVLLGGDGKPVAAQFEPLARWGSRPDDAAAPIKWLLVGCRQSVAASGTGKLTVKLGKEAAEAKPAIRIDTSTAGRMIVDTGAARFELRTGDDFNLIEQVTIGGQAVLDPLTAEAAISYAALDTQSIVGGEGVDLSPRKTSVTVERSGPLEAEVKVMGSIPHWAILDFTARLHFVAGRSDVGLDFTVENNHPIIPTDEGQPSNAHNQGAANSVYVGDLALLLRLRAAGGPLTVLAEQGVKVSEPKQRLRLYQDSSGLETWNVYVGEVGWPDHKASAAPRLQSFCKFKGYQISGGGLAEPKTGDQSLGWMAASRGSDGPAVAVAVREFWQNFPTAIDCTPDGKVIVHLFPNGDQFRHNLRVGEEKTYTVLVDFRPGPTAERCDAMAKGLNSPLTVVIPPEWTVATGVLGEVPAADLKRWPLYERYVRTAFEPNPDFDPVKDDPNFGNRTLQEAVRRYNFFGWQDYGDVPLDYEAFGDNQAGQMNLKYWFTHGMLVQFLRSGEPRWLDVARPAARHLADIDILHVPDEGPQHWAHGAYFGHSAHDEPGNLNPNRNSNSPSVDLFYGVPDLLLAYHLTGERRFREVAVEALESMERMSEFSNFTHPVFERERANLIFGYIEAYRATGDQRWLRNLQTVVRHTGDLSTKQWVTDPAGYGKSHGGEFLSTFMFGQVVWSLGRYLDFCAEYGIKDELGVAKAIAAYADFALKFAMKEFAPGRAAVPHDYYFDGSEASYLDQNNWALVMADLLAYAFKVTGQQRYMDAAAKFYATGTIDQVWADDPPVYMATKDLANPCNLGLVFMNQSVKAAGGEQGK